MILVEFMMKLPDSPYRPAAQALVLIRNGKLMVFTLIALGLIESKRRAGLHHHPRIWIAVRGRP
ncbi:hypothetical protein C8N30_1058 [Sulfitobacter guttiformis]|uniref:Uncharacterized protein n=1 Tax=Sulfitobacter guttiformis TaxID=74349 RepID=A0A420DQV2_9RHOB|nr:hypothetical protein C8N30_1058 [Sulfitobacter guttiformis]